MVLVLSDVGLIDEFITKYEVYHVHTGRKDNGST